jgi:uncharacterized membrane protein (DUF2068 family)
LPRRDRLLGLIGGFKLVKRLVLLAAGTVAFRLTHADGARRLAWWIADQPLHPGQHWVDLALARLLSMDARTLRQIGAGTFVYAGVFLTEGMGLLLARRWAEYLTVVVTASFLPLELYDLARHVRLTRVLIAGVNLAIVLYLIARLRAARSEG